MFRKMLIEYMYLHKKEWPTDWWIRYKIDAHSGKGTSLENIYPSLIAAKKYDFWISRLTDEQTDGQKAFISNYRVALLHIHILSI